MSAPNNDYNDSGKSTNKRTWIFDPQMLEMTLFPVLIVALVLYGLPKLVEQRQKEIAERRLEQQAQKTAEANEAKQICDSATALFAKLDGDNDGLLFEEELRNHHLEGKLAESDAAVVSYLYNHCRKIGHVVGRHKEGKYMLDFYAISKIDLKLYAERLAKEAEPKN